MLDYLLFIIGLVGLYLGAEWLVKGSSKLVANSMAYFRLAFSKFESIKCIPLREACSKLVSTLKSSIFFYR